MAKIEVRVEKGKAEAGQNPLLQLARKVLMASMGAVALSQEEAEKFVNKLIERGEIAEKDGKKLIQDVADRRRKETEKAGEQVDVRIEAVLNRMNVPARADIEALSDKITALTKAVDELKKA